MIARRTHKVTLFQVKKILTRVTDTKVVSSTSTKFFNSNLSEREMKEGCKAGLDTWADTCCVGKHAHVREIIEGKVANANGFADDLPTVKDIPIVHCSLAYDDANGRTFILDINNALYLGDRITNVLLCPNQCETNGIRIDLRNEIFYPQIEGVSTVNCHDELLERVYSTIRIP